MAPCPRLIKVQQQARVTYNPLKQSSVGTLLLVDPIIYSFFDFLFFKIILFFLNIFTQNRHYRLISIAMAIVVIGWPKLLKRYVFIIKGIKLAIRAYFDKYY